MNPGYGTGRIHEIIDCLLKYYKCKSIIDVSTKAKLDLLCRNLDLSYSEFDDLIIDNSPVLRTVKGHVFETFFDTLLKKSGFDVKEIGGDQAIDRVVNGFSLQLKTPTLAGTSGNFVQYKTHKTHGAKSEQESLDYYHRKDHFADFLVGLVTTEPLNIVFISNDKLPLHPKSSAHILSPFTIDWSCNSGLNAFDLIGVTLKPMQNIITYESKNELMPRLTKLLGVSTEIIVNTILNKGNFRIWDMTIRGFAREKAFKKFATAKALKLVEPRQTRRARADKADYAILLKNGSYVFLQMKGVSTNNCLFNSHNLVVAVETQLTRGRVNDHPTQSRLYLKSDFDYLIIALDPALVYTYREAAKKKAPFLEWEFYAIPTIDLESHHGMSHRLKSLQKFSYSALQKYKINKDLVQKWI